MQAARGAWGGNFEGAATQGCWNPDLLANHISFGLELFALQACVRRRVIELAMDKSPAIACRQADRALVELAESVLRAVVPRQVAVLVRQRLLRGGCLPAPVALPPLPGLKCK
jgi:hypothetical protein